MNKYRVTKKYSFGNLIALEDRQGHYVECDSEVDAAKWMLELYPGLTIHDISVQLWN